MKLVPRTKREPGVTWMRPFGPMISAKDSHSHTPGFSRTKCLMKLCTVRFILFLGIAAGAADQAVELIPFVWHLRLRGVKALVSRGGNYVAVISHACTFVSGHIAGLPCRPIGLRASLLPDHAATYRPVHLPN
jgi:hypothetical protein